MTQNPHFMLKVLIFSTAFLCVSAFISLQQNAWDRVKIEKQHANHIRIMAGDYHNNAKKLEYLFAE